jgi:hypothetical protein
MYIKKFNEDFNSGERVTDYSGNMYKSYSNNDYDDYDVDDIIDILTEGKVIKVSKEKIKTFLNIFEELTWIKIPESQYSDDVYYFILIGENLYHMNKPYIGEFELDVYDF